MNSDVASFYLSQMRSEIDDYVEDRYMIPFSITLNTPPKVIAEYLKSTLKNRIN